MAVAESLIKEIDDVVGSAVEYVVSMIAPQDDEPTELELEDEEGFSENQPQDSAAGQQSQDGANAESQNQDALNVKSNSPGWTIKDESNTSNAAEQGEESAQGAQVVPRVDIDESDDPDMEDLEAEEEMDQLGPSPPSPSPSPEILQPSRRNSPFPLAGVEKVPSRNLAQISQIYNPPIEEERRPSQYSAGSSGENLYPFFNPSFAPESNVFSEGFKEKYVADYSMPEPASSCFALYIPPNMPPVQVVEVGGCVCKPDKNEFGCGYFVRITCSILAHVAFFASLAVIILRAVEGDTLEPRLFTALIVSYVVVVAEALVSHDFTYLQDGADYEEFQEYMDFVYNARPTLRLIVECFHYRPRIWAKKGVENSPIANQDQVEKVVTHIDTIEFNFREFEELSPKKIDAKGKAAAKVTFFSTFSFADDATRQEFEHQSSNLREVNRTRDKYMSYYERFEIPGFFEQGEVVFMDSGSRRCKFSAMTFVIASMLLCSWPYRWFFKNATAKTTYTFVKQLKL